MKRLALALALIVLPISARADVTRAAVSRALSGYENAVTQKKLEALGDGWQQAVLSLAGDRAANPMLRVRAVYAARFVHTPESAAMLRRTLELEGGAREGVGALLTAEALGSLGEVQGAAATPILAPYLAHPVPDVRVAAGAALKRIDSPEARRLVEARRAVETEDFVKQALTPAAK